MKRARGRRLCAALLTLVLAAALLVVMAPTAQAKSTKINRLDIACAIDANGDAVITEVIDIDAYEGTEFYQIVNIRGNQTIRALRVSENGAAFTDVGAWDTGASDKAGKSGIVTKSDGYELCFGLGEYGNHVFQMQYEVENFVSRWSDSFGVNYMFFSDMTIPITEARITLEGPDAYSEDNASIWAFGYKGAVVFENGRVVMEPSKKNPSHMQLLMLFENDREFTHTNDYDSGRTFQQIYDEAEEGSSYGQKESGFRIGGFLPYVLMLGVVALVGLFRKLGTKRVYEDKEGHAQARSKDVTPYRDIPCDKDLVVFSSLLTDLRGSSEFLKTTLVSAYILKWLQNNNVSVVEGAETGVFKKTQTYRIVLSPTPTFTDLNEKGLYDILWAAAGEDHILEKNEFQRYCKKNYTSVENWFDAVKRAGKERLQGSGLIRTETVSEKFLFFFNRKRTAEVYTRAYNDELARVNGFRRFLEDEDNMAEKSMIEVKLWDEYLIFAAVMGIADTVYRQVKVAVPQYNERYYGYDPYMAYVVANDFGEAGARGVAAGAADSGGSSSIGGGGSSFSGGGGGGVR
ncbi:MAG: DUF2207 domain-containing protein [Eubacterium sp.]|nr:DUF2207 domain-containing protein [Eubacterium sp.]